ncbi:MAG: Kelch repeat-containing protein, partial [Planctomycetota bacterium]
MARFPWYRLVSFSLLLIAFGVIPGCGLVWWGAAAGIGFAVYDSTTEEEEEEPPPLDPAITSLSSDEGEEIGGQTVTINGENFQAGCQVFFGPNAATPVTFVHGWMILCVTPPYGTTGSAPATADVDVRVRNPDGKEAILANGYRYVDTIAPAAVSDLTAVRGSSDTEAVVSFTAVGDNGTQGQAVNYELKYHPVPIDDTNWNAATVLTWTGLPVAGGLAESQNFTVIAPGTYYFALKVQDDAGHWSPLSNVAQFDPYPPAATTDLIVYPGSAKGRFVLEWTAVADDGSTGVPVTRFILRCDRKPILSNGAFSNAMDLDLTAAPAPAPANPGVLESREVEIPEHTEGDKYYFALRCEDDAGNLSPLSNCVAEQVYVIRSLLTDGPGLPSSRRGAAVVYDPNRQRLIVYGGWDGSLTSPTYYNDVWAFQLRGKGMGLWQPLSPVNPLQGPPAPGRWGAAAVWDPLNQRMVIFGGETQGANALNDAYYIDFASTAGGVWNTVPNVGPPPARRGALGIYDPFRRRMLIVGGYDGTTTYGGIQVLNLPTGSPPPAPTWAASSLVVGGTFPTRWGAAGVFLPELDGIVVFGGHFGNTLSRNDLRFLRLSSGPLAWVNITPINNPGIRGEASFAYDPFNKRFIVTGGISRFLGSWPQNNAWVCTVKPGNPPTALWRSLPIWHGIWGTGSAFDRVNQRMIYAFGATNGQGTNLNSAFPLSIPLRSLEVEVGWKQLANNPPMARAGHAMAYDVRSRRIVMFGGTDGTLKNDTRIF